VERLPWCPVRRRHEGRLLQPTPLGRQRGQLERRGGPTQCAGRPKGPAGAPDFARSVGHPLARARAKSSDRRLTCSDVGVKRLRSGADSGPSRREGDRQVALTWARVERSPCRRRA
jgi:hypothetical protein